MKPTPQDIEDVEFICAELVRFARMGIDELRAYWRERPALEALYSLPRETGRGQRPISKEAYFRFGRIAKRQLSVDEHLRARASVDSVAHCLRDEFVRRFMRLDEEVRDSSIRQMFDTAYDKLIASFESRTYYLPCSVVEETDPAEFQVGPVTFMTRALFWERHQSEFEEEKVRTAEEVRKRWSANLTDRSKDDRTTEQAMNFSNNLFGGVRDFFGFYDWIAIVEIPPAEANVSERLAQSTVRTALDILKLIMGANHSDKIRVGSNTPLVPRTGSLMRDSSGRFHPSITLPERQNSVGANWFSYVNERGALYLLTAGDLLRSVAKDFFVPTGISARFLDALHWFGDAVTEPNSAAELTKYVFAMERATVISTGKKRPKITATVSNRCAIWWQSEDRSLLECIRRIREIYKARSDLAHGDRSPFSKDLDSLVSDASKVARMTLLGLLQIAHSYGYELSDRQLLGIYTDLDSRRS